MTENEIKTIRERVLNLIRTLARSQGSYGRLLAAITEAEDNGEDLSEWYAQFAGCKDPVDIILAIEG